MKRLLGKAAQGAVQIHIHVHSSAVLTSFTHGRRTPLESDVNECH